MVRERPQLRALVDSNDGVKNLVVSGDAWIRAVVFGAIAKVWIEEGAPLGLRHSQGGRDRLSAVTWRW